jgi:hypothetical protein
MTTAAGGHDKQLFWGCFVSMIATSFAFISRVTHRRRLGNRVRPDLWSAIKRPWQIFDVFRADHWAVVSRLAAVA